MVAEAVGRLEIAITVAGAITSPLNTISHSLVDPQWTFHSSLQVQRIEPTTLWFEKWNLPLLFDPQTSISWSKSSRSGASLLNPDFRLFVPLPTLPRLSS